MFADYQADVVRDYEEKKRRNALSLNLIHPTRANIRKECLAVFNDRFQKKDENVFRAFFGAQQEPAGYLKALTKSDPEDYKTLDNYLKKITSSTDTKNIELLAWLIDFEQRPYRSDSFKSKAGTIVDSEQVTQEDTEKIIGREKVTAAGDSPPKSKKERKLIMIILLAIAIAGSGYLGIYYMQHRLTGHEGCMIWDGDHYWPVECHDKSLRGTIFPINKQQVENFKLIKRTDTLTPYSIGKVYYIKYNGQVEFFTTNGRFPADTNRRLLPMSAHILDKYIYHVTN
ncbi:hypothetical protein KXD93_22205 [Mucilaginibacter sp. BJC16-A38]|uniref:hypothetical protein n=1 Tax=Mucilaginibacter phenanthrenivorans TaxID=1234842 RepID=UPI002157DBD7|nr:hypothetical protein [Mucilaginibacter phenanthrenivorans]MCR8560383.1 hypothetical protein [Mucilaginibacter phenanthrenivorans]